MVSSGSAFASLSEVWQLFWLKPVQAEMQKWQLGGRILVTFLSAIVYIMDKVPTRVDGRFRVGDVLGFGSYAVVYRTWNIIKDNAVAIKLEPINHSSSVQREYRILKNLEGGIGIPCALWRPADQSNVVVGLGDLKHTAFLIDFGTAKEFWNTSTRSPYTILPSDQEKLSSSSILEHKVNTTIEVLCQGIPVQFATILIYMCALTFSEDPDYNHIRSLLCVLHSTSPAPASTQLDFSKPDVPTTHPLPCYDEPWEIKAVPSSPCPPAASQIIFYMVTHGPQSPTVCTRTLSHPFCCDLESLWALCWSQSPLATLLATPMDFPSGTCNHCTLACSGVSHGENLYRQHHHASSTEEHFWVAPKAAPALITAAPAPITATPLTATPLTATPAVAPIAAAANVSVLQNPPRRRQLPVRFRDNGSNPTADKGESFHLENISDDEEDEAANPPALTVTPVVCPSPLQTAMNTARTDPLATGGRAKPPKSSADVHFFYRQDPVT
ncbi:kinase-like domain-containing protein [Suillus bovinus]|uniref:kinase-like domain-containing protein n=1 Tax=Suillus bovinus TaxID=48563 RepID=UPI001B86A07B|nr:kinase-like domain-containing protein [Suillus bovinus]KAG2126860.1 kinase-like domain-containing protein [Suillus bovinus]